MTPCQLHEGKIGNLGYGWVMLGGKQVLAHRLAFAMGHGVDPAGKVVRHKCDNPPCVNPDHLELGTHADNMADKKRSGVVRGENNPCSKLTRVQVDRIMVLFESGARNVDVARDFGISATMAGYIRTGKKWNK